MNIGLYCGATCTLPRTIPNLSPLCTCPQVCISKPSKGDEDGLDLEEEMEEEEEVDNGETDRPAKEVLVTPFLSRVLPAGTLRGKLKPAGAKASGLVEVRVELLPLLQNTFPDVPSF